MAAPKTIVEKYLAGQLTVKPKAKPSPAYTAKKVGGGSQGSLASVIADRRAAQEANAPVVALPGSYDPALDAQLQNANLGFLWAGQDYGTNTARLGTDQQNQLNDLIRSRDWSLADLARQHGYNQKDFRTQGDNINLAYQRLANQQGQQAQAAGVAEGGALAQALLKRVANRNRDNTALNEQSGREYAAYNQNVDRTNSTFNDQQLRDWTTQFGRAGEDLNTNFGRAGAQNALFAGQVADQKAWQAKQNGMLTSSLGDQFTQNSTGVPSPTVSSGQGGPYTAGVAGGIVGRDSYLSPSSAQAAEQSGQTKNNPYGPVGATRPGVPWANGITGRESSLPKAASRTVYKGGVWERAPNGQLVFKGKA